jgi:hypothetical protein
LKVIRQVKVDKREVPSIVSVLVEKPYAPAMVILVCGQALLVSVELWLLQF